MAGMKCLKFMLCAFNLVFWAAGIAVMAVGIFARVSANDYTALTGDGGFQSAANIMIAAGALVMIIGVVGCCGAMKENKWLLLLYFFLVLLIFILEVAAGILAYSHKDEVIEKIEKAVNATVMLDYGNKDKTDLTEAIDKAQQKLECCGVQNSKDWLKSAWKKNNKNLTVPQSCCTKEAPGCNQGANPDIYKTGCSEALQNFVQSKMSTLGGIGVGIAIIQILGMIFSICMFRSIGYEKI